MTKKVGIVMGSDSDLATMENCVAVLEELRIPHEVMIMSAHRTPGEVRKFATGAKRNGFGVIISAAGLAAHLGGVIAAYTRLPVIGVPMDGGPFKGMDALLSTVQMPPGVPVATVAVGKAGARNAAYLAARILALGDKALAGRLERAVKKMADSVRAKNRALQKKK